jgi:uncharacterized protein YodC (DUF2158 family)
MSEQNALKIGDTVALKSGGPDMTVSGIDNGWIECTYWNQDAKNFDKITLHSQTVELAD